MVILTAVITSVQNCYFTQATIALVVPLKSCPNQATLIMAYFLVFTNPHHFFDYFEFARKSGRLCFFYFLRQLTS
jgi:hypothetical protein